MMLRNFQKFLKSMGDITHQPVQCSFVHFLAYFGKFSGLGALAKNTSYPKQRNVLHYICLNGHTYLLKELLRVCPQFNIN